MTRNVSSLPKGLSSRSFMTDLMDFTIIDESPMIQRSISFYQLNLTVLAILMMWLILLGESLLISLIKISIFEGVKVDLFHFPLETFDPVAGQVLVVQLQEPTHGSARRLPRWAASPRCNILPACLGF